MSKNDADLMNMTGGIRDARLLLGIEKSESEETIAKWDYLANPYVQHFYVGAKNTISSTVFQYPGPPISHNFHTMND